MIKFQVKDSNDNWIDIKPITNLQRRSTFVLIKSTDCVHYAITATLACFELYELKTEFESTINPQPCLIIDRSEWEMQGCE